MREDNDRPDGRDAVEELAERMLVAAFAAGHGDVGEPEWNRKHTVAALRAAEHFTNQMRHRRRWVRDGKKPTPDE